MHSRIVHEEGAFAPYLPRAPSTAVEPGEGVGRRGEQRYVLAERDGAGAGAPESAEEAGEGAQVEIAATDGWGGRAIMVMRVMNK